MGTGKVIYAHFQALSKVHKKCDCIRGPTDTVDSAATVRDRCG